MLVDLAELLASEATLVVGIVVCGVASFPISIADNSHRNETELGR
jgi:hypothetical protein